MSLTKAQAQANTTVTHDALVAADNAIFIANADAQILEAIVLGKNQIQAWTFRNVDPKQVYEYYAALGYQTIFPDITPNPNQQPANLFGEFWTAFWMQTTQAPVAKNPIRMLIGWYP